MKSEPDKIMRFGYRVSDIGYLVGRYVFLYVLVHPICATHGIVVPGNQVWLINLYCLPCN